MSNQTKTFKARFVAPRYEDPCFAIINIEVTNEAMCDESTFFAELRRAVTEWVKTTDVGKLAWKDSCQDLNIGDFISGEDINLILPFMPDVVSIDLDQIGVIRAGDWTYDTVLVNEEELDDDAEGSQS